jgi:rubrerythrin
MLDAETEGNKRALTSFRWAMEAEKVHEILYRQALEDLGKETAALDVYVCPVCGYVHFGTLPDKCPICGTTGTRFQEIK